MRMSLMTTSGMPLAQRRVEASGPLEAASAHAGGSQRLLQHPADGGVVIEDPRLYGALGGHGAGSGVVQLRSTGSSSVKIVQPGRLVNSIMPSWRRTRSWAIGEAEARAVAPPAYERVEKRVAQRFGHAWTVVLDIHAHRQRARPAGDADLRCDRACANGCGLCPPTACAALRAMFSNACTSSSRSARTGGRLGSKSSTNTRVRGYSAAINRSHVLQRVVDVDDSRRGAPPGPSMRSASATRRSASRSMTCTYS